MTAATRSNLFRIAAGEREGDGKAVKRLPPPCIDIDVTLLGSSVWQTDQKPGLPGGSLRLLRPATREILAQYDSACIPSAAPTIARGAPATRESCTLAPSRIASAWASL